MTTANKTEPGPPVGHRLLRNSGFLLAAQVWFLLLSLATTPYIIGRLGVDRYGIFAFLLIFSGYLSHLDLGLGWALIKFVAEHDATGDGESLQRTVGTATFMLLGSGLVGALVLLGFADVIATRFLRLPPALAEEAIVCVWIAAGNFALNAAIAPLNSLLRGLQRFDLTSVLQAVSGSVAILGTVWVLHSGWSLREVLLVYAGASGASFVAHVLALSRLAPGLSLLPRFDWNEFRRMFSFSVFTTYSKVGIAAIFQLDKLFVAYLLPVAYLSYYAVSFNVAQKLNLVASNAATVLFPFASQRFAVDDRERYAAVYRRAAKLVFLLTAVPAVVLMAFAGDFLRLWLGPAFEAEATGALIVLALGFLAVSVCTVEAVSIEGAGIPRMTAALLTASGALNLVLCPALTMAYGITGAAAALATSAIVLAWLNIRFFNLRIIRAALAQTLREIYVKGAMVVALVGLAAWLAAQLPLRTLAGVMLAMAVFATAGCSVGFWTLLSRDEQSAVKSLVLAKLR